MAIILKATDIRKEIHNECCADNKAQNMCIGCKYLDGMTCAEHFPRTDATRSNNAIFLPDDYRLMRDMVTGTEYYITATPEELIDNKKA